MIYRPLYVEKIFAYQDAPFVKILTGMRRCGKSTLLKMLAEKLKSKASLLSESCNTALIPWSTRRSTHGKAPVCGNPAALGRWKTYIFLDESQMCIPGKKP